MKRFFSLMILVAGLSFGGELERVQKIEHEWQTKFGLSDWTITLELVGQGSLQELMQDDGQEFKGSIKADQRNTVAHELLHIVVRHYDKEQGIDKLAALLLR